jgi:hypothetical protein
MKLGHRIGSTLFSLFASAVLVVGGCGPADNKGRQAKEKRAKDTSAQIAQAGKEEKKSDHSGWWCVEHGVPEEVCGQCNTKLAATLKKKGDWCKEHDRPDSQCFLCHPELKDKFAAQYRAKYGKEPPPLQDEPKKEPPPNEEAKP